jgi:multiple antibiotic resistance protein
MRTKRPAIKPGDDCAGSSIQISISTLLTQYQTINILAAIIINIGIVFIVLKNTSRLEKLLGTGGINILRKVFGIIILAIAVKLFQNNFILKSN